jgi:hypothetical protein
VVAGAAGTSGGTNTGAGGGGKGVTGGLDGSGGGAVKNGRGSNTALNFGPTVAKSFIVTWAFIF